MRLRKGVEIVSSTVQNGWERARILFWRGAMSESPRLIRRLVALVLVVSGIVLTFTQLGFVNVVLPNGNNGYVVVLLQVVALGALLLGAPAGLFLGIVTGAFLLLHAKAIPLDQYELAFITPISSIVMFAVVGALLGVLFAFVLRNNPSRLKRIIYIVIVCLFTSTLYSVAFFTNAFIMMIVHLSQLLGPDVDDLALQQMVGTMLAQFGSFGIQVRGTALLMAVLCGLGDYLASRFQSHSGALGLRTVFGAWLSVVVTLSFMAMAAVNFVIASADGLRNAKEDMRDEVSYLIEQMQMSDTRLELLQQVAEQGGLDFDKVDQELLDEFGDILEQRTILEGYIAQDRGIVLVFLDGSLYVSNDSRFERGSEMRDVFTVDSVKAIEHSIEDDRLERIVFAGPADMFSFDDPKSADMSVRPKIAFVYARQVDSTPEYSGGDLTFVMLLESNLVFAKRPQVMASMTLSAFVLLLVVYLIVFLLLNRLVARRIDEENGALALITGGDLEARAQAGGTREFESLTEGINVTVDALRGWIREAETRMDTELATARAIQESALPRTFPPYPDIPRFDIYASMKAARQVGGDFYDFFLIGDSDSEQGKLGFVVADVSGKGVPAALFMMRAKALLRDYVGIGMELGEAVSEANRQLVEGNDADMFVTAWVGVLDYATGHIDYVNAGHNPPLVWQREGGWRWMRQKSGPMLGLFEVPYQAHELECVAGDTLLLYTDGVTEAFDVDENLYGEKRLLAVAEKGYRLHPRELLESVRADVAEYSHDAEQSDDITILTHEVGVPPEITATLKVPAQIDQLGKINGFLHAELNRRLCPQRVQNQLDIAVEELFVNVCRYAYPDADSDNPGYVRIQRTYSADPPSILVDIIDDGIPFDPLAKPDAVTPDNIEDVPIGGLGILMAKKCTDEMRYEYTDDSNVVSITVKW